MMQDCATWSISFLHSLPLNFVMAPLSHPLSKFCKDLSTVFFLFKLISSVNCLVNKEINRKDNLRSSSMIKSSYRVIIL